MDFLPPGIAEYAEANSSQAPEYLERLERITHSQMLQSRMLSGFLQGRFLSFVSKCLQPGRVLEVGTYTGYSALCFAEGLAKGGKVISLEIDEERVAFAGDFISKTPMAGMIDVVQADVKTWLVEYSDSGTFDLIFLDGDKRDYPLILDRLVELLSERGVLLADNVLWSGKVLDPSISKEDEDTASIKRFTELVLEHEKLESLLLPIRDGLLAVRRRS
jgi:predicted O-methyltransferase YrrM